jgi:hypothetical protein
MTEFKEYSAFVDEIKQCVDKAKENHILSFNLIATALQCAAHEIIREGCLGFDKIRTPKKERKTS